MTARVTVIVSLVGMAAGIAVGRALPRGTPFVASSPSSSTRVPAAPDRTCQAVRSELATVKAQLGICMAYAAPRAAPAPTSEPIPAPPLAAPEPQSIDAMLAELPAIRARRENARELVYVEYGGGRVRSYLPEEWPPDGGIDGGRVIMRKLPDGTWESYDPFPQIVQMAGPPGPDGLVVMPDGRRVRYVFTDAGAP